MKKDHKPAIAGAVVLFRARHTNATSGVAYGRKKESKIHYFGRSPPTQKPQQVESDKKCAIT
jgi:hypothetical protein